MNRKGIITKTAKGMREASGATHFLARDQKALIKAVDGKSTLDDLAERLGQPVESGFGETLERLAAEGYIQEALITPLGVSNERDLDFTRSGNDVDRQREVEAEARRKAEETSRRWAAERARRRTEERARRDAEERAAREAQEQARLDAEKAARKEAEAQAKRAAEERMRREAEEQARREAEAQARREAEERAARKAQDQARRAAEEAARKMAAAQAKRDAEERARREAEQQARRDAEVQAAREAQERVRREVEAQAKREAEEQARREAEEREAQEAEERARSAAAAAEEQARRDAEEQAVREAEERVCREVEEQAKREAEEQARREAEAQVRREAEEQARREAEEREAQEAEERARAAAAEAARMAAEEQARREAEEQAAREAEERVRREAEAEAQARREAEEQARREAEEEARREAENQARLEAEEEARREAEEQARLEAEDAALRAAREHVRRAAEAHARKGADDRTWHEVEEPARHEVEEPARHEAEELALRGAEEAPRIEDAAPARQAPPIRVTREQKVREAAERRAARKARRKARKAEAVAAAAPVAPVVYRRPVRWGRPLAFSFLALVAGGLALLHLMSFDSQIARFEKIAAERFQQPVKVRAVHLSLWLRPHWILEGVTVGNAGQIQAPRIRASSEFGALLHDEAVFPAIEIDAPVLTEEGLGWLLLGKAHGRGVGAARIEARNAMLRSKNLSLPPFDASAEIGEDGNWRTMRVGFSGTDLVLDLAPAADAVKFSLQSTVFAPTFLAGLPALTGFSAEGTAGRNELRVTQFEGRTYDGTVSGNAHLRFGDEMAFEGEMSAKRIDMATLMPGLFEGGLLDGAASFVLPVHDAGKPAATPRLAGRFVVQRGVLAGIDMGSVLKSTGHGGRTRFARLEGTLAMENSRAQLRQLQLDAGAMSARGNVDVAADRSLHGRVDVELSAATTRRHAVLDLSGAFAEPYLKNADWTRR